jgi:glycine/D-amino acid oxidase-like deaminating enzyme
VLHLGSIRPLPLRARRHRWTHHLRGQDEEFADEARRDAQLNGKEKMLEKKLAKLLPKVDTRAQFAWTASFGQSKTGLPSIGPIPGYPRCYAVLGYGGNGITFSMLAAQLVAAAMGGRRDPDASLFAFPS